MATKRVSGGKVPNLRFPGFEGEWEEKSLGDLMEFKNGINASKEQYGAGVKFINVLDILNNDYITYEKIVGKVDVDIDMLNKYPVKYGDILFQRSSETREEVGTANVYLDKEHIATFGGFVIRGRKISEYDPIFLNKLLKTDAARDNITSKSGGSTRYNVGQDILASVTLKFPSLFEQKKIADFLTLIDNRIQTQNKIIKRLETLIKAICQNTINQNGDNKVLQKYRLRDVLVERVEANKNNYPIFSVSVSKGVINQIEFLGRSFAAKDTSNYNVAHYGDVIYTKSPTREFPYGIIKQSFISDKVAVSPLYGIFTPKNIFLANLLHYYFQNPINANNYLHSLVQKGAKNTINISNQRFLDKEIYLPINASKIEGIAKLLNNVTKKIHTEKTLLRMLVKQKQYFLQNLFI